MAHSPSQGSAGQGGKAWVELGFLDRLRRGVPQDDVHDLAVLRAEEERLHRSGPRRRVAVGLQVVEVAVLVVPAVAVVDDVAHRHDDVVGDLPGVVPLNAAWSGLPGRRRTLAACWSRSGLRVNSSPGTGRSLKAFRSRSVGTGR